MVKLLLWWIDLKFKWQNDEKNDSNAKNCLTWEHRTQITSQTTQSQRTNNVLLINGLQWSYFIVVASLYISKSRICGLHFFKIRYNIELATTRPCSFLVIIYDIQKSYAFISPFKIYLLNKWDLQNNVNGNQT